jgi:hypothetical protein
MPFCSQSLVILFDLPSHQPLYLLPFSFLISIAFLTLRTIDKTTSSQLSLQNPTSSKLQSPTRKQSTKEKKLTQSLPIYLAFHSFPQLSATTTMPARSIHSSHTTLSREKKREAIAVSVPSSVFPHHLKSMVHTTTTLPYFGSSIVEIWGMESSTQSCMHESIDNALMHE